MNDDLMGLRGGEDVDGTGVMSAVSVVRFDVDDIIVMLALGIRQMRVDERRFPVFVLVYVDERSVGRSKNQREKRCAGEDASHRQHSGQLRSGKSTGNANLTKNSEWLL